MILKAHLIDISTGRRSAILNEKDAEKIGVAPHDRVKVRCKSKVSTAIVDTSSKLVAPGQVGLCKELQEDLQVKEGDEVEVIPTPLPQSTIYIRKKMFGGKLTPEEIDAIVKDVVEYNLSDLEISAFLLSELFHGMDMSEIESLTKSMVKYGEIIDFGRPVYDKHSIGGVPGNKVSLLIVPIVAAAGLLIPKTSSKAITSPSGTADTMSVLANVELTAEELKEVALKVGGCIAWGGTLNLAPADDIFIRVEHPLRIDPEPQLIASIMAKKLATSVKHLVIDIPTGKGAKVETMEHARELAAKFIELGNRLGINVKCGITYGGQPVGHAVGPALEAREALEALMGGGPMSLVEKSTALAGLLLEMGGVVAKGFGKEKAMEILRSGKALQKMREIIEAQGGDPNVKPEDIPVGDRKHVVTAPCDGYITQVDNKTIVDIARAAGAPADKGAGVLLHAKVGYKVKKGDVLMEIYAERSTKLQDAVSILSQRNPIVVEGMLLQTLPEY